MSQPQGDRLYQAFMETFRGTQEQILKRMWVYEAFLRPLAEKRPGAAALDIGCGRGEFLGFLTELGFKPVGVDFDEAMLEPAREHGYQVVCRDGLEQLESLPDASLHVVAAFHVVEHLPFDVLRRLIREAFRALAPGGVLMFETPNPESLTVATHNFWYDPTHVRPLPPGLLRFVIEFEAGARTTILRLQQPEDVESRTAIGLTDVLFGVSPDYAVVAQKRGDPELEAMLDDAFGRQLGTNLHSLSRRHDMHLDGRLDQIEGALAEAKQQSGGVGALGTEVAALRDGAASRDQAVGETMDGLRARAAELTAAVSGLRDQAAALGSDLAALRDSAAPRDETVALAQDISALRVRMSGMVADMAALHGVFAPRGEAAGITAGVTAEITAVRTEMAALDDGMAVFREEMDAFRKEMDAFRKGMSGFRGEMADRDARVSEAEQRLLATLASRSWRVTAPIRFVTRLVTRRDR